MTKRIPNRLHIEGEEGLPSVSHNPDKIRDRDVGSIHINQRLLIKKSIFGPQFFDALQELLEFELLILI